MKVFLITQKHLLIEYERGFVKGVDIQRLSENEWVPIFDLKRDTGEPFKCSLRVTEREEVKKWVELNRLIEWMRNDLKIYHCTISATDADIQYRSNQNDAD
ncbi:hypothetical protein [Halomonas sp. 3A7M]|uniref:hypothetical protein n=1 Tax=Halomonas sp. 3A7M TaxID=2742616 RepID=UPI001D0109D6|nr:hypothetical protein [Halomonas sp. 3A7M]